MTPRKQPRKKPRRVVLAPEFMKHQIGPQSGCWACDVLKRHPKLAEVRWRLVAEVLDEAR